MHQLVQLSAVSGASDARRPALTSSPPAEQIRRISLATTIALPPELADSHEGKHRSVGLAAARLSRRPRPESALQVLPSRHWPAPARSASGEAGLRAWPSPSSPSHVKEPS